MKIYRISKWAFGSICLLIIFLPVSRQWKLLTTGERTTGTVRAHGYRMVEDAAGEEYPVECSEIEFEVHGVIHTAYGPADYEYKKDRTVTIFYKQDDPTEYCVATFTGFYLDYYTVLPVVLLLFWYAFYLSFNNYRKRMKMPGFKSGSSKDPPIYKEIRNAGKLPFK